jgi:hypothetical protein
VRNAKEEERNEDKARLVAKIRKIRGCEIREEPLEAGREKVRSAGGTSVREGPKI